MADRKVVDTVELETPVEYGSELIDKIEIYKPKGKDMKVFLRVGPKGEGQAEALEEFMSNVTGRTPRELDELDGDDWGRVMTAVGKLAPRGPKTGQS